jgi:phosphoribosyl-dephospho-CoA transferase
LRELPALSTLQTARPMMEATGLPWGPTGSVGFELATGVTAASPDSDLDLVIRMPDGTAGLLPLLVALHRELSGVGVRVDCQVESPIGAIALAELAGGRPDVLVRTAEGPRLVPRAIAVP